MLCLYNACGTSYSETFLVYKLETFKNFKEVKHIMIMIIAIVYIFVSYVIFDQQLKITFRKFSPALKKSTPHPYSLSPKNLKSASPPFLPIFQPLPPPPPQQNGGDTMLPTSSSLYLTIFHRALRTQKHFLNLIEKLPPLPPNALLVTADVMSLYTNTLHGDDIPPIIHFMEKYKHLLPTNCPAPLIVRANLDSILKHSTFNFEAVKC